MPVHARGFTLIDLLVTLGIGAVLLGLAVPGLAHHRGEVAVRTATSQTLAALQLARRLALARGQTVTVCPSSDGTVCAFGGGQWLLFANDPAGTDNRREAADELLQRWQLPAGVTVTGTRGYAAFQPRPGAGTTVTFQFCHPATAERTAIVISQTGRARTSRTASGGAPCTTH